MITYTNTKTTVDACLTLENFKVWLPRCYVRLKYQTNKIITDFEICKLAKSKWNEWF